MAARGGRGGRGLRGRGRIPPPEPEYDHTLFRSAAVAAQWEEERGTFRTREVEPGRVVAVEQIAPFFDVGALFEAVGWAGILRIDTPTRPALVRYFFANLQFFPEEPEGEGEVQRFFLSSRVRGVDIHITEELLAEIFGLSPEGARVYWGPMGEAGVTFPELETIRARHVRVRLVPWDRQKTYVFSESEMRDLPRVVCRILQHNVIPQSHHRDEVSSYRLYVTDAVVRGVQLCLPFLILSTMIDTFQSGKACTLPYGKLLTHLLQHVFQVPVDVDEWAVEELR